MIEDKLKNGLRGLLTGVLAAPFVTLFANLVSLANEINASYRYLILLLPLSSVIIVYLFKKAGPGGKKITAIAIREIHFAEDGNTDLKGEKRISAKDALISFITSIISHLSGASVGKEGVGVQIGLACSSVLQSAEERLLGESRRDYYYISGAAAAFSALFGSPVAGTLFGTQLASPRLSRTDAMLPAALSSFSCFFLSRAMGIHIIHILSYKTLDLTVENAILVFFFAILVGLVCRLSCHLLEFFKEKLNLMYPGSDYIKAIIPATALLVISIIVYFINGSFKYNGLSTDLLRLSMFRAVDFSDFIIKLLMVLLSLAAGFQGGEVVPLLVLGATFSSSIASALSLDTAAFSALGAIGFLAAGTKLSLVTFALGLELFGYSEPCLLFLMTTMSLISSGKIGIYSHQRIY